MGQLLKYTKLSAKLKVPAEKIAAARLEMFHVKLSYAYKLNPQL